MATKKEQLQTLAGAISLLADGDIPHGVNSSSYPDRWNEARQALRTGLPLLGDFFLDTDGGLATLLSRFNVDHATDGTNLPPSEWVTDGGTPVFVNAGQFQLAGDRRTDYAAGHRVRALLSASPVIVSVTGVSYDGSNTTVTVTPASLTSQLAAVARGLVRTSMPRVQTSDLVDGSITDAKIAAATITGTRLAAGAAVAGNLLIYPTMDRDLFSTGEIALISGTYTSRGGTVLALGQAMLSLSTSVGGLSTAGIRLYRAGIMFGELRTTSFTGAARLPMPMVMAWSVPPGSTVWELRSFLTVESGTGTLQFSGSAGYHAGHLQLVELS